jgi:GNAT superfamily N-acetyltransferase
MTKTGIRAAAADDWRAIWSFMRPIVAAGETFSWERDIARRSLARVGATSRPAAIRRRRPAGRVIVTAESKPDRGGPGAHVSTASFMIDPDHQRKGVGRTPCAHVLETARADGYRVIQFDPAVETNTAAVALWRSFGFKVLATVSEGFHQPLKGYVGFHITHRCL